MEWYANKPWLANYSAEMKATVDIPEMHIPEVFSGMCDKYGKKAAVIFYGRQLTYRELYNQVVSLASSLSQAGIGKGDVVALYLLNSPQYIISYMAVLMTGATVTPVSPVFTSHELKYQLTDSEAKAIVCQDILYDNFEKTGISLNPVIITGIEEYLPPLRRIMGKTLLKNFSRDMDLPTPVIPSEPWIHQLQDLVNKKSLPPSVEISPDEDLASITYSGGTTGAPKGVMLSHRQLIAGCMQFLAFIPSLEMGKEVFPAYLPLYHAYGQMVVMLGGITTGATMVIFTTPDIDSILDSIERYGVTIFFGVPTFYEYLKEYDKTSRVNWRKMKLLVCGADTLHERTAKEWERRTGSRITEGYGQTESGGVSMANPVHKPKQGSIGIPITNITAAILHPDENEFLPPGEVGEISINGVNVATGYWRKPEASAEVFTEFGGQKWMRTGDMGYMDEEGYFYFVDRKRDLIKYKGYSVFARDVEEVLYSHPHIRAAGVVGIPDPRVGQLVKAYVVLQPEARGKISEEEIIQFCQERLSHYKVPRIVEFQGELPKTDVGKVSRRELREQEEAI
ncbi:MAG: AMP-binding protein [Dethiobacter sp.]|jgi:long-chain acyl-CoA synthetase|nr:AMP-binding protein [Dethiobacter sp.]